VVLGYYAQNQEDILDKNETVYSTLENAAPGEYRQRLRDILGAFLFKGEDVDKKVAVLSGGERARLAMAKLILKPYNLLCLDEPTNHMDIQSKDILKQALQKYDGTLVIVSHDRDFLNGLVDKVYEFRDGKVKEHLGGIVPYLEHLEKDLIETVSPAVKEEAKKSEETASKPKDSQIARAESKEERRRRKEVEKLENEIAELDFKIEEIEMKLSSPESQQQVEELSKEYSRLKDERDQKLDKWMEAAG
ncbi:MAG: ABC-F family ATP-binding cassette domain-containing protein, partial [Bacteroidales bacterium]|nr:ABC-F family ATP-binding cassette domain-containing protein [Bacteroidales bacterium]